MLSAFGIQSQGTATLGRLDVIATYRLVDFRSGAMLETNTIHVQNSFALNPNQYSTVVGEDDAAVRSVAELSQEIVTRLDLFMEHRAAEKTPKAELKQREARPGAGRRVSAASRSRNPRGAALWP